MVIVLCAIQLRKLVYSAPHHERDRYCTVEVEVSPDSVWMELPPWLFNWGGTTRASDGCGRLNVRKHSHMMQNHLSYGSTGTQLQLKFYTTLVSWAFFMTISQRTLNHHLF